MADVLKDAADLIESHALLEADAVLRHLVAEVERLRAIEKAALDCVGAEEDFAEIDEQQGWHRWQRWKQRRNNLAVLLRGRT